VSWVASQSLWIVFGCTLAFELFVLRRLRFDWITTLIVLAGTVLAIDYLAYTSLSERNYDGPSHAAYIQFLGEQRRLPDLASCQFCAHPPLYYALAALWAEVVLSGGWMARELGLQWFSLLLFFGFVVFALLMIRRSTKRRMTRWLAALLVVFWPASIIHSVRVHNDALASLLMIGSIYWLAEWDRRNQSRDLYAALACAALALLTKASAYSVAATLVIFVSLRLFSKQEPWATSVKRGAAVVVVLAGAGFLGVALRDSGQQTLCQSVLGRACYGRYVPPLPDTLGRFLSFHPLDFLGRIDTVPTDPFLNRFLKSILFGVQPLGEDFASARYTLIAGLLCALLLVMLLVCLIGVLQLPAPTLRRYRVYLAAPVIMFAFLVGFRVLAPNEFHEDFRHIFPALVPFCLGYAKLIERFGRSSKTLYYAGVSVALALTLTSVAFFVRLA
jgi:hypothetical protein